MGDIREQALRCREAAARLATLQGAARGALISAMAQAVPEGAAAIRAANDEDVAAARGAGSAGAMLARLALDPARRAGIVAALREVAALPDPVGQVTRRETRPNGIVVERV